MGCGNNCNRTLYKKDVVATFITRVNGRNVNTYLARGFPPTTSNFALTTAFARRLNPNAALSQEQFNRIYNFAAYGGSSFGVVRSGAAGASSIGCSNGLINCDGTCCSGGSCCLDSWAYNCGCKNPNNASECGAC